MHTAAAGGWGVGGGGTRTYVGARCPLQAKAWLPRPLMSSQRSTWRSLCSLSVLDAARSHITVHASTELHAASCAMCDALRIV